MSYCINLHLTKYCSHVPVLYCHLLLRCFQLDALLHGHSYTAHAIGCSAAVTALRSYKDPTQNANYLASQHRLKEVH